MSFSGDAAPMEPETKSAESRSIGGAKARRREETAKDAGSGRKNCGVDVEQENAACYNKTK